MPVYKAYNNHEINDIIDDAWVIGCLNQIYLFNPFLKMGSYRRRINYYNV